MTAGTPIYKMCRELATVKIIVDINVLTIQHHGIVKESDLPFTEENIYLPEVLEQNQNLLRPIDYPELMEVMKNFSTKPVGNLTGQRKKV